MTRARTHPSADDTVADDPSHDDSSTPDSHDARPHDTAAPAPLAELRARIATAASLLLLEVDGVHVAAYTTVAEQMASWPAFGLPGLAQLADSQFPAALGPVSAVDVRFIDRIASERAFTSTSEITELLAELEREPAHELARGGLALPDAKRLAHAMSVDLDSVRRLLEVAERAGLAAREAGSWLITDAGCEWLLDSSADRWRALVAGWLSALPADIRTLLGERSHALWGDGFGSFVEWLYPAGGEWIHERVATYTEAAELLGITANQAPSGPGILLFSKGPDAAAAAMATLLPREVEQVYLQHDLSIVAPGPLTPRVDNRLRSLADVEGRALASSYRVSTSSLNRALAAGETAESVQEFLGAISLTGIPQPLAYLIAEASRRYGLLRVGDIAAAGGSDARSYVTSPDEHLLTTVLVDQNLSTLGLRTGRLEPARVAFRRGCGVLDAERRPLPGRRRDAGGRHPLAPPPAARPRGAAHRLRPRTRADRAAATRLRDRTGGLRRGVARPAARRRHPQQGRDHGHRDDAERQHRELPARTHEPCERTAARQGSPRRHRTHPAARERRGHRSCRVTHARGAPQGPV